MNIAWKVLGFVVLVSLGTAAGVLAQNRCYDCHQAQQIPGEEDHLRAWRDSVHERADVGCEDCHGGNAKTLVQLSAHRGVRSSLNAKAPTHWANLPTTCGSCHETMLAALQTSKHWELFSEGRRTSPTCATCHGSLAVEELGSGGLSGECGTCHGIDSENPRSFSGLGILEKIRTLRDVRGKISRRVLELKDPAARHDAGVAFFGADSIYLEGVESGHAFAYSEMFESLALAEVAFNELSAALSELEEKRSP